MYYTKLSLYPLKQSKLIAKAQSKHEVWRRRRCAFGWKLFALDSVGNIIFYYSFNKTSMFGWDIREDIYTPGVYYPIHWKSKVIYEAYLEENKVKNTENGATVETSKPISSKFTFYSRHGLTTYERKILKVHTIYSYFYYLIYSICIALIFSLMIVRYSLFRQWINPPAKAGLERIETNVYHFLNTKFIIPLYKKWVVFAENQLALETKEGIEEYCNEALHCILSILYFLGYDTNNQPSPFIHYDVATGKCLIRNSEENKNGKTKQILKFITITSISLLFFVI